MHASSKAGNLIEGYRGRNRFQQRVRPETPIPMHDGDTICLVPGITATLRWQPITVCLVRVPSLATAHLAAARLGLHLVPPAQVAEATHVCVPAVRPNKTQLLALVYGCPLVSDTFVQTLLHWPPEAAWAMPDPSAFLPPMDARLTPEAHIPRTQLVPDARRRHLFQGATLVLVIPGAARRYTDMAELAQAAGADVHIHDVSVHPWPDAHEAERALAQLRARTSCTMYVMVADDVPDLVPSVQAAAARVGLAWLPEGLAAITQGLLRVQRWDEMVPVETHAHEDTPGHAPGLGDTTMDVTSEWASETVSSLADSQETQGTSTAPSYASSAPGSQRLARASRLTAADVLQAAPAPTEPAPAPPLPVSTPPAPSALPRRAGTRQARRSHLLDELLGVPDTPGPSTVVVHTAPREPTPPLEAPPSSPGGGPPVVESSNASPLSMTPLERPSLLQVRVMPMVRTSHRGREARRPRRRVSRRIALVLDAPTSVQDTADA